MRPERLILLVAVVLALAGCMRTVASTVSTAQNGSLTLSIATQRSQPGCPIMVRVNVAGAPAIVRGELAWRVAHGKRERSDALPLTFVSEPTGATDRTAEIALKLPYAGTYDIEARVLYETGETSVAVLRHDVAHRWPFQAPRPCDFEQSAPHEASVP